MSLILEIPAIIRVLFVFALILIAIRKKFSLGNSFLFGSISLGLIFGFSPVEMGVTMVDSIIYPKTLSLAIIVSLILVLSNSLEKAGQMERLLTEFKRLVSHPKINLVIFPALIGLLPMPGGAVFSAPMVKDLGADLKLSNAKLSYINYWFRHVWEYSWPLYPGILLATILADINIVTFVLYMCPITILAFYFGYWPLKEQGSIKNNTQQNKNKPSIWPFFKELLPILIVIFPGLILGVIFSYIFPNLTISKELGLHIALVISIIWVWHKNAFSLKHIAELVFSRQVSVIIYMVLTIVIFKDILEHCNAAKEISFELIDLKIPLVLITMTLPFLIGMISGYTLAYVGVSLPILIPLIQTYGESAFIFPYVMLVMVCGFLGVLFSPLHLCYILSNQYFNTTMGPVYKYLWKPCLGVFLVGIGYFFVSYRLI